MVYFDPRVKEKKGDFYNFEALQSELKMALENQLFPLIVVHGLRRTGKSSLIRVVLSNARRKYIWIDGRNIDSKKEFYKAVQKEIEKQKFIKIKKIVVRGIEIGIGAEELEYLNKHKAVLVVDEAQLLKKIRLDNVIGYIYDNFPRIKIVLSGSESGMLISFLGRENPKAPLYGRAVFELMTKRLEKEASRDFLTKGAKQVKISITEKELWESVAKLDGIIGWLTKYGWHRLKNSHKQALRKTIKEGRHIVKEEFIKFAAASEKKYKAILKAIKGSASWEEIKKETLISDKQLYTMLKRMINYGFIEKKDKIYNIADPLLEAAV